MTDQSNKSVSLGKLAALLVCSYLALTGCTKLGLFVVNRLAAFSDYSVVENISYGAHELQRLSVYTPGDVADKTQPAAATIVFFYGGCWGGCETLKKGPTCL